MKIYRNNIITKYVIMLIILDMSDLPLLISMKRKDRYSIY